MIKQNIHIVNYVLLYEILDEIKDNLPFKITKHDSENDFNEEKNVNLGDTLIITKLNNKSSVEKNVLVFNDLPLPLIKLVELINISLIKLKFNQQSRIEINGYELNLNSKFFSKNGINLKLTEKEIEMILYLNVKNQKYNVLDLQKNIWGYSSDLETHTVETHIYRLRKKISDKFGDENFIESHKEGYFIK
jgi:DNA-binding response OmpR family regulator